MCRLFRKRNKAVKASRATRTETEAREYIRQYSEENKGRLIERETNTPIKSIEMRFMWGNRYLVLKYACGDVKQTEIYISEDEATDVLELDCVLNEHIAVCEDYDERLNKAREEYKALFDSIKPGDVLNTEDEIFYIDMKYNDPQFEDTFNYHYRLRFYTVDKTTLERSNHCSAEVTFFNDAKKGFGFTADPEPTVQNIFDVEPISK